VAEKIMTDEVMSEFHASAEVEKALFTAIVDLLIDSTGDRVNSAGARVGAQVALERLALAKAWEKYSGC
jgi:dihydropteroate synthase